MMILTTSQLSKEYEHGLVLKNIDFQMKKGSFVSIMGPSGSGKSTFLYMVSGMEKASSGDVHFNGENITHLTEKERALIRFQQMGFVFQEHYLLKNLTILENITLATYLDTSIKRAGIEQQAVNIMKKVGIGSLRDRNISEVSGGQLQRATIARALMNKPNIVFADEPTGALNTAAANDVMDILLDCNRLGMSILLVTHDAKVAAKTDHVYYMLDGEIVGSKFLDKYSKADNESTEREARISRWLYENQF